MHCYHYLHIVDSYIHLEGKDPVAKMLGCDHEVSEFELKSSYMFTFGRIALGNVLTLLFLSYELK